MNKLTTGPSAENKWQWGTQIQTGHLCFSPQEDSETIVEEDAEGV